MTSSQESNNECIIPISEVMRRTSLSKPTLWRMRKLNKFPDPVNISQRRKGWAESQIDKWIADRFNVGEAA